MKWQCTEYDDKYEHEQLAWVRSVTSVKYITDGKNHVLQQQITYK